MLCKDELQNNTINVVIKKLLYSYEKQPFENPSSRLRQQ